jgi:hypothetical protein
MRSLRLVQILVTTTSLGILMTTSAYAAQDLPAAFRKTTQALVDAITSGDKTAWDRTLDPACIVTSEDGDFLTKAQMLADVRPLPSGFAGHIAVRDLTVRELGDAAVVHYWLDEVETVFGQELKTTYVQTDIYRRASDGWRMVAMHVTVVPRDFEAIAVDSSQWKLLLGDYSYAAQAASRYHVFQRDGVLYGGTDVKTATKLIPLAPLVFHQSGSIHIMVFVKDPTGAVNEVRELHKYNEVKMRRVPG